MIDPLAGQTVFIDVSNDGGKTWTNVGSGTTNATGNFTVPVTQSLPNSPYNVGPDGLLNSPLNASLSTKNPFVSTDDSGYSMARVRIVDQSGNASNLPTDPLTSFQKNGAVTSFVVDTADPKITSFSPSTSTVLEPDSTGSLTFTFTVNKNVVPTSVNATSIQVLGAGADGVFGTNDDVLATVGNIKITPLRNGAQGPEQITFTASGSLTTGQYMVTLKGTGAAPIEDIAGNALDGGGRLAQRLRLDLPARQPRHGQHDFRRGRHLRDQRDGDEGRPDEPVPDHPGRHQRCRRG